VAGRQLPPGVWVADAARSSVGFTVRHTGTSTLIGRFDGFRATLTIAPGRLAALVLEVEGHQLDSTLTPRCRDAVEVDGVLRLGGRALVVAAEGNLEHVADELRLRASTVVDRRQLGLDCDCAPLPGHEMTLEAELALTRRY
jgi:polyisoprenoid-binding protein YceI